MRNTPAIIYICGIGLSGSTTLDLLLSLSDEIISASQLNDLLIRYNPHDVAEDQRDWRDRFWSEVLHELSDEEITELRDANQSVLRERALPAHLCVRSRAEHFARVNDRLLASIFRHTQAKIVVDSSKNIARGVALLKSTCPVYFIHMVRGLRAFTNSYNKRRIEQSRRRLYLAPALNWCAKNLAARLCLQTTSNHYLSLRYDDLISEPEAMIAKLETFLETPLESSRSAVRQEIPLKPS